MSKLKWCAVANATSMVIATGIAARRGSSPTAIRIPPPSPARAAIAALTPGIGTFSLPRNPANPSIPGPPQAPNNFCDPWYTPTFPNIIRMISSPRSGLCRNFSGVSAFMGSPWVSVSTSNSRSAWRGCPRVCLVCPLVVKPRTGLDQQTVDLAQLGPRQRGELLLVELPEGLIQAGQEVEAGPGDLNLDDAPVLGDAGSRDQALFLETVHQARHVRHACDHVAPDLAAGAPRLPAAAEDAEDVVRGLREPAF